MKHEKIRRKISVILAVIITAMGVVPHIVYPYVSADTQQKEVDGEYDFIQYLEPKTFDGSNGSSSISNSLAADLTTETLTKVVKSTMNNGSVASYYSKGQAFYIYYVNNITDYTVFDTFSLIGSAGCFDILVKVPKAMSFTVKVRDKDNIHATYRVTTTASYDWQSLRIPVADMTYSDGYNSSNAFERLTAVSITPEQSAESFLAGNESIYWGGIELYKSVMPESGDYELKYALDPKTFDGSNGSVQAASITPERFTKEVQVTLKAGKASDYYSKDQAFYLYYENNVTDYTVFDKLAAMGENGYFSVWLKTPHAMSFTLKLRNKDDIHASVKINTAAYNGWQEIFVPASIMTFENGYNLANAFNALTGISLTPDRENSGELFLKEGEAFTVGRINVYNMTESSKIPDKRFQISPWRDDATKKSGVMTAAMGDTVPAPDSSNDFGKYYSFTVGKNFYTLDYASANHIYMLTTWSADKDFSVLGNKDSFLRLWVKTPHAATFTVSLLDGSYVVKGSATVTSSNDKTDWQYIDIPLARLNISADLDLKKVLALKLAPAGSADKFLSVGETFTFGAIDLFEVGGSEIVIPEEPEGPIEFTPASYLENQPKQYSQNGKYTDFTGVDFSKAVYWQINSEEFYTALTDYTRALYVLAPVNWTGANYDFSLLETEGYMRLYYKTEKPASFKISILDTKYQERGSFSVTTASGTGWQYADVNVTDMTLDGDFDFSQVLGVKILASDSAEKFVETGKQIVIGSMYLYKGDKIPSGGDEKPEFTDLGTFTTKPNHTVLFDAKEVKNSACSAAGITVKEAEANTSLFTKSMKVTLKSSESYFAAAGNITFYTEYKANIDLWDGIDNGYIDIWIKTPHSVTMQVVADKTWPNASIQFTTENGTDWQRIRLPMSNFTDGTPGMSYNGFVSLQIRALTAGNFILDGESFELGRITFVCPNSDIGSSGANRTYPVDESSLTKYTGGNYKVTTSTYQFWSSNTDIVKNEYRNVSRDDENYFRFTNTQTIWLEESLIDDYYAANAPIAAMIYLNKESDQNGRVHNIDIEPFVLTGTVRFWIKAPKKMTFYITMRNGQANNDKSVSVPITVEPVKENGGFKEVRIPIREFYDSAVEQNVPFRFDQLDQLGIKAVTATREGFLDAGEKLIYSQIEIWSKEAVEPVVPDKTKIYQCSNNSGIIIIDKNEIMPETTVINAFRNTKEAVALKKTLLKWSEDATYFDTLCIRTVSDNSTDARLSNPYESVTLRVSEDYLYTSGGVNDKNISQIRAVVCDDGSYKNVSLTHSDGYIYIDSSAMGDYIFYIGTPGEDIEKQYPLSGGGSESGGAVNNDYANTADDIDDTVIEDSEDENASGKKVIKKVVRKKKAAAEESSKWWLWTIICVGGALVVLGGGFLGYRKFISKSLCLLLILGIGLCAVPISSSAESEVKFAELRLADDHPGAPGFNAEYEAVVYYGAEGDADRLEPEDYTLYCDYGDITINGSKITVPASFMEKAYFDGFKLYVKIKNDNNAKAYYPIMIKKWSKTVEDNFDGNSLDTSKWTNFSSSYSQMPQDSGKYGQQSYCSADCASVENGNLVLKVLDGKDGVAYSSNEVIEADFLMPRVTSKFKQQYGCFSADIKFPYNTVAPSNSAFWLLPSTGNWGTSFLMESKSELSGFSCGEIDIIEYSPAWLNGKFQSAMHWWNNSNFVKYSGKGTEVGRKYNKLTTGKYVNMSCVWTYNSVYVYSDGILMRNTKNVEATGELAYVLFTIQTAGYGEEGTGHWLGGLFTKSDIPKMVMYVDSFKAYK